MKHTIFIGLLALSSQIYARNADLTVNIAPNSPYLLPVAIHSCHSQENAGLAPDVPGNSFEVNKLDLSWNGPNDFFIHHLEVRLVATAHSSAYKCVIAAQELSKVFPETNIYEGGSASNKCSLRCGGLSVDSTAPTSFQIPGVVRVVGATAMSNGQYQDLIFDAPLTVISERF